MSSAESPGGGGGALSSAGGGRWWRSPGAGESWRRDAPESGGGWTVFFPARTGQSTLLVGGPGCRYGAQSSVSSPETPLVVPPVSSRGISSEFSLARRHPVWGAWQTSACPE